ncbi:hypothetical protein SEA_FUZZBUSTER_19 [Microbacterium phage FuzzBuster]|uniref:Uncharacterized protein n=1 Tax=Microbacterium phage FuzzBuster TaxID=2590935 RepID=A0A516KUZ1_9CAUD|nr:hypothetical protein SEA_FUZZBUSTER_19 [Microbacterium phage FuzzBuster]
MTEERKIYTCLTCDGDIRARFDGPVPVSELGKPYYEHVVGGEAIALDHDPVRKPRETPPKTDVQTEFERAALHLAKAANLRDQRVHGTMPWQELDAATRNEYYREAQFNVGALGLLGWAPLHPFGALYLQDPRDTLKMLRETLCEAQSAIWWFEEGTKPDDDTPAAIAHVERIGRIIAEIDRQRPLGTDGKHGNLHTPTCGCEDR